MPRSQKHQKKQRHSFAVVAIILIALVLAAVLLLPQYLKPGTLPTPPTGIGQTATEAGSATGTDATTEAGIESGTEPGTEAGTEAGSETATESGTELTTETATEAEKPPIFVPEGSELEIHFLELGNYHAGDCIYIRAGENDILIDGGSTYSSVTTIQDYLSDYVTDGTLEYVIVTHAHKDHYACFAGSASYDSLFDLYDCEVIIDFAQTTSKTKTTKIYQNYQTQLAEAVAAGATHYTAAQCITEGHSEFNLGGGITMTVLDSYYYYHQSSSENNHSVCTMLSCGEQNFYFFGDLEGKTATNSSQAEHYLIEYNELPKATFYKASHHGSNTSSSAELLAVLRPEIVVIPCVAGSPEYTDTNANMFPTQQTINTIAPYTKRVYVPSLYDENVKGKYVSLNGNIVIRANGKTLTVSCSVSNTLLADTDWFRENRTCPDAWK